MDRDQTPYRQHYTLLRLQNIIQVMLCYVMPVYLWYTQYIKFYQAPQIIKKWFFPKLWRCWRMAFFLINPMQYNSIPTWRSNIQEIPHFVWHRTQRNPFIWYSEDRVSWYILIMKANEMHYFSILFDKLLYIFRTDPPSIIRSISILYKRNRYLSC